MTERDASYELTPNSITWEIVQALADGFWRDGADILRLLEYRRTSFTTPNVVKNAVCRLVRLGILERQSLKYRLTAGATFELGEGI